MRVLIAGTFVICGLLVAAPLAATPQAGKGATVAAPATLVNLNSATREQLEALPGIGPRTAALILEYRQKSGGFKKVEELMNIKGIGEKSFLKLKPMVVVPLKSDKPTGAQ